MSIVHLAKNEPYNHLMVPEFNAGSGGNFNLAFTQTTTTILSIPPGQIQPVPSSLIPPPVGLFPNAHKFKMNHYPNHLASGATHIPVPSSSIDKLPCDLRTSSSALVSSSQVAPDNSSDMRLTPLNGLSAVNDSISAISSSRSIAADQAISGSRLDHTANGSQALHPYGGEVRVRNKSRQPKYRSTKRPPCERKFKCDHCESRFFTQKDVKRHLVVHTGVRNFACPFCTQRFGRKDHLVRHAKKSHNQDTRSFKRKKLPGSSARTGAPASTGTDGSARRPGSGRGRGRRQKDAQNNPSALSTGNGLVPIDADASGSIQHHIHHHHHMVPGDSSTTPNYQPTSLMAPSPFYPANPAHSALDSSQTHHHHFMPPSMASGSTYVTTNALAVAAFSKTPLTGNYHSSGHYDMTGSNPFYNRRQHQFMLESSNPQQYPFHLTSPAAHPSYYASPTTNFYSNSAITPDSSAVVTSHLPASTATTTDSTPTTATLVSHFSSPNDTPFKSVANSVADSFNMCIDPDYLHTHPATTVSVSSAANVVNLSQLNASSFHPTAVAGAAALVPGSGGTDNRYF